MLLSFGLLSVPPKENIPEAVDCGTNVDEVLADLLLVALNEKGASAFGGS